MTVSLKRYQELQAKIGRLEREQSKAEGALEQYMKRLKDEHGCDSIKAAEKKLEKLNKQVSETEQEFTEALDEFEQEWGGVLEGMTDE